MTVTAKHLAHNFSRPDELLEEDSRLADTRWLVVASDPVTADALACTLRAAGAAASLVDPELHGLARLQSADAQFVLADGDGEDHSIARLGARVRSEQRLRGAVLLSPSWQGLWAPESFWPDLERLCALASDHVRHDRALRQAARSDRAVFEADLAHVPPMRILQALSGAGEPFQISLEGVSCSGCVYLVGDLVLHATVHQDVTQARTSGLDAMFDILALTEGVAQIERGRPPPAATLALSLNEVLEISARQETLPREQLAAATDPQSEDAWSRQTRRSGVVGRSRKRTHSQTLLPPPAANASPLQLRLPSDKPRGAPRESPVARTEQPTLPVLAPGRSNLDAADQAGVNPDARTPARTPRATEKPHSQHAGQREPATRGRQGQSEISGSPSQAAFYPPTPRLTAAWRAKAPEHSWRQVVYVTCLAAALGGLAWLSCAS